MIRGLVPAGGATQITIQGDNPASSRVIDGAGQFRAFFVESGRVLIQDVTVRNVEAVGGTGGTGSRSTLYPDYYFYFVYLDDGSVANLNHFSKESAVAAMSYFLRRSNAIVTEPANKPPHARAAAVQTNRAVRKSRSTRWDVPSMFSTVSPQGASP